ncbi:hypothetical protein Cfla_0042 [Cellulomonas flavigena DSM 20109]|uniref:Uncharacterized protein n=1 Tax=Cellulomonas flavigena (strain ATCC 482 / DSM 20109 / BCRC 11376 / JCM 18109 / NBRC 3775 / NCIMB 8073 / NRS 134) TaxID=446466 RepID=D5UFK3_CELFN|nr:hypothetical protein Cfla_0042 [Cellulomonas flavigena DSM 20109]
MVPVVPPQNVRQEIVEFAAGHGVILRELGPQFATKGP